MVIKFTWIKGEKSTQQFKFIRFPVHALSNERWTSGQYNRGDKKKQQGEKRKTLAWLALKNPFCDLNLLRVDLFDIKLKWSCNRFDNKTNITYECLISNSIIRIISSIFHLLSSKYFSCCVPKLKKNFSTATDITRQISTGAEKCN